MSESELSQLQPWAQQRAQADRVALLRGAVGALKAALPAWTRGHADDARVQKAHRAAEVWCKNPQTEFAEACAGAAMEAASAAEEADGDEKAVATARAAQHLGEAVLAADAEDPDEVGDLVARAVAELAKVLPRNTLRAALPSLPGESEEPPARPRAEQTERAKPSDGEAHKLLFALREAERYLVPAHLDLPDHALLLSPEEREAAVSAVKAGKAPPEDLRALVANRRQDTTRDEPRPAAARPKKTIGDEAPAAGAGTKPAKGSADAALDEVFGPDEEPAEEPARAQEHRAEPAEEEPRDEEPAEAEPTDEETDEETDGEPADEESDGEPTDEESDGEPARPREPVALATAEPEVTRDREPLPLETRAPPLPPADGGVRLIGLLCLAVFGLAAWKLYEVAFGPGLTEAIENPRLRLLLQVAALAVPGYPALLGLLALLSGRQPSGRWLPLDPNPLGVPFEPWWWSSLGTLTSREIQATLARPVAYMAMFLFLVANGYLFVVLINFYGDEMAMSRPLELPAYYWLTNNWILWVSFIIICPAISMRLLAEEAQLGTLEGLFTTPVTHAQVVLSKFAGVMAFFLGMLLLSCGYLAIVAGFSSDWDWGPLLSGYLGLVLAGALFLSMGLFTSSLTRSQVVAFVLSVVLCLSLWIAPQFMANQLDDEWARAVLQHVDVSRQQEQLAKGLIHWRTLVFYVSSVTFFLFLSVRGAESHTWR